jgi:hypothetical protein
LTLRDLALRDLPLKAASPLCQLCYQPSGGGWQVTHDRSWFLVWDRRDLVILRMMVQGTEVAQCNISPLPRAAPEKFPTLPQFQDDVQHALGKSFGQLVESGEVVGEANYRIYRVVAKGEVAEVPIQWQYYFVADDRGRQITFVFTVQQHNIEAFEKAGDRMIRTLRFVDSKPAATAK